MPLSGGPLQAEGQSAADLVKFLTYQTKRPDAHGMAHGLFDCGSAKAEDRENGAAADALVKLGREATSDIETALDSIETQGQHSVFSTNSAWLVNAYARIQGASAYHRLRRMSNNPNAGFLRPALDKAIAVALGLTSYVSSQRSDAEGLNCSGVLMPHTLLDRLILGWERNDQRRVEASLGPLATAALRSMRGQKQWDAFRTGLWPQMPEGEIAIGYRFRSSDGPATSEPKGPLDSSRSTLDTIFTTSAGDQCGIFRVEFLLSRTGTEDSYLVDNADIDSLLRLMSVCASGPHREPVANRD